MIRNNPQPGTPAYEAWEKRKAHKAERKAAGKSGGVLELPPAEPEATVTRVQPKKQSKAKRKPAGQKPTGATGVQGSAPDAVSGQASGQQEESGPDGPARGEANSTKDSEEAKNAQDAESEGEDRAS